MDITAFEKRVNNISNKVLELIKITTEDYYRKLVDGYERVIDTFYAAYPTHLYRRKGSLYEACKIKIKNGIIDVSVDASYMEKEHRVSNDYIFNVVFMKGWHGGAVPGGDGPRFKGKFTPDSNDDVPSKLTPHYRQYPWDFEYWGEEAVKTMSPYKMWLEEYKNITDETVEKHKALTNEIFVLIKQANDLLSA